MSVMDAPAWLRAAAMEWVLERATTQNTSDLTKATQVVDQMSWAWRVTVTLPMTTNVRGEAAGRFEALVNLLAGGANTIRLHHMVRPQPLGTLRGTPTLAAAAAQFAAQLQLQAVAGATLRMGDMVGVGGQLLQVADDCQADGSGLISVPLVTRVRRPLAAGAAVVWDKPTARFFMVDARGRSVYSPGRAGGQGFELLEDTT